MKKFKLPALVLMFMLCICVIVSCDSLTTENPNETNAGSTAGTDGTEHEHTIIVDSAVAPTCTETGLTEGKHCSVCNEIITAQEIVAALGHTEAVDATVAPTCTETGLTEGKHCSVCNEILTAQETIAALWHSYSSEITIDKEPTCVEAGSSSRHCAVCDDKTDITEIPSVGHNYAESYLQDSDTMEYTCTYCSHKYSEDVKEISAETKTAIGMMLINGYQFNKCITLSNLTGGYGDLTVESSSGTIIKGWDLDDNYNRIEVYDIYFYYYFGPVTITISDSYGHSVTYTLNI